MRMLFISVILLFHCSLFAQSLNEYQKAVFTNGEHRLPYRVLYPLNFDVTKKYPLLIFLHGALEKGNEDFRCTVLARNPQAGNKKN
jgi:predicted peptidase